MGPWVLGRGLRKKSAVFIITSYQGSLPSTWFVNVDVGLGHQAEVVFVGFLPCTAAPSPPAPTAVFRRKSPCAAHTEAWGSCFPSMRARYPRKLLGILLHGTLSLLSPIHCHALTFTWEGIVHWLLDDWLDWQESGKKPSDVMVHLLLVCSIYPLYTSPLRIFFYIIILGKVFENPFKNPHQDCALKYLLKS